MINTNIYGEILSNSFNSAISSYAQKVKPRVFINFLDSRHLDNLTITTNDPHSNTSKGSRGYFFSKEQSVSGTDREGFSWAVCDAKDINGKTITANGEWYAMPSDLDDNYKYGWWSETKSQSSLSNTYSGYGFATNPYIEAEFTQRKVNKIRISTSEHYGQIQDYTIYLYNQSLTLILQEDGSIANGTYYTDHVVSEALVSQDVYKVKVVVNSTKNPEDYARIVEISPIYEVDLTNYVISHSIDRIRDLHESSLPIGGTGSSSASITLDNTEKVFNPFNNSSLYGKYMKKDLKISIDHGWRIKKTDDVISSTTLLSSIDDVDAVINVKNGDIFPDGGSGNYFVITIDPYNQNKEHILCSSKTGTRELTVSQRGYGGTSAKAHSSDAVVIFDPYEYIHAGEFYIDEWSGSSSMQVIIKANDWSKFIAEKQITKGFFVQNTTSGDAVKHLLMMNNFPKSNYKQLVRHENEPARIGAVAQYYFNEKTIDRSNNEIVPGNGLRARFWGMREGKENQVKDILADAIDKDLSEMDKALGYSAFTSPDYVNLSTDLADDPNAVVDYNYLSFTSFGGNNYEEYFNGVLDGFYVPEVSGIQEIFLKIKNGGGRVYLDNTLIINEWFNHPGQLTDVSSSISQNLDLDAGVPYSIRIEFFHANNTYVYPTTAQITAAGLPANLYPTSPVPSVQGNIVLTNRPLVYNDDGSISTLLSMSFNDGSYEVIIPKVVEGKILSDENAKAYYRSTGQHLGKFPSGAVANAESYAIALHNYQESWLDLIDFQGFDLQLWANDGGGDYYIDKTSCYTTCPIDSIGARKDSYSTSIKNFNHNRNYGVYIGQPKLGKTTGIVSEPEKNSLYLTSNAYVRIPYDSSLNMVASNSVNYTGSWTIETYIKIPSNFTGDGEFISNWSNSNPTAGFEIYSNSASNGIKLKTSSGTKTVSSNTSLANNQFNHLVFTCDGNTIKYYLNGQLANSVTNIGAQATWNNLDITIGGRAASYTEYINEYTPYGENSPPNIRSFYIDEFCIYNKALTSDQVKNRYITTQIKPLTVFPFLYGNEKSIKELIDDISLSDFGRFYIEETDYGRYDHFYRFFESSIDQHSNVQTEFSSNTNIVSGDYNVQLQANKVTVNVSGIAATLQSRQRLWGPDDPTTLGVVTLSSNINSSANTITVNSTDNPPFPKNGYIKIDNEIIKYNSLSSNAFKDVERGQFNTTAASHTANTKVREVRYFDIKYDKAPAFNVQNPFVSAIQYEDIPLVEIHSFKPTGYGAELIFAASNNVSSGTFVYLQGTSPLTGFQQLTSVAGTPIITTEQSSQVKSQSASLASDIRKYGLKEIVIDNPYISSSDHAKKLADFMISKMADPVPVLTINAMAMPKVQLGDRIKIVNLETLGISNTEYWVTSHTLSVGDTLDHSITLRKVS